MSSTLCVNALQVITGVADKLKGSTKSGSHSLTFALKIENLDQRSMRSKMCGTLTSIFLS